MRQCTFEGCEKRVSARGLCSGHYRQMSKGQPLSALEHRHPRGMPPEEKFWLFVDKETPSGCWVWRGGINEKGYGKFNVATAKTVRAHRFAWELLRGSIPDGYVVDHDNPDFGCHNPACCNPDHLQLVTNMVNIQRRRKLQSNNTSGERGVHGPNSKGLWRGEVKVNGKVYSKYSKDRDVVSAWVVEMRSQYHE